MLRFLRRHVLMTALLCGAAGAASAQLGELAFELEHPAIEYWTRPTTDRVAVLGRRLQSGQTQLRLATPAGYLRSLLDALEVPVESQIAVFSKTSLQGDRINPQNPRTIFFNDSVVVAWVRGGFIEIAAHDSHQGGIFYRLENVAPTPQFVRDNRCLGCHFSVTAQGVAGFLSRSIPTAADGAPMPWLGNYTPDHRSPLAERWGGYYVTGRAGSMPHLGNAPIPDRRAQELPAADPRSTLDTLTSRFETGAYLSPHSDIVALLVFEHQMRMMNMLTRLGWQSRVLAQSATPASVLRNAAVEVVDYLLFVDEAPLRDVRGTSGYAEKFSAAGPRDPKGRSLRDLDLKRRLLRYPCSYMVYSEAFDALPADAKDALYRRLWQVLSGEERAAKYRRLSAADRQAIIDILRATKKDLPRYFWTASTV